MLCRSDGEAVAVNLDIEPVEKPENVLLDRPDASRGLMRLSVLDQSISLAGSSEDAAIRDTVSLAEHCETLGYERFWVSEHHSLPTIVGSAPEVVMAAIAARTTAIRIGSAGIMLPHYSALKVAEQFRVLEALAPGRIDLGVGRAPGSDMRTARALNPNASHAAEDFPVQVRDLHAWTSLGTHAGITAHPLGPNAPEMWMLGSSDYGAQLAAHYGLPYAFAYFITDGQGAEQAMALYRRLYRPSERHPTPEATLCVWALAADTDEEAGHHSFRASAGRSTASAVRSARCSRPTRSRGAASATPTSRCWRRCGRAPWSARPRRGREDPPAGRGLRARRGGRHHLDARPGGAPALVRTAGRRVRADAAPCRRFLKGPRDVSHRHRRQPAQAGLAGRNRRSSGRSGSAEGDELAQAKADATLLWIKAQEDAGLDIVGDGEQSRQHFVHGFLEQVEGIDFEHKVKMGIRDNRYDAMVPQVVAPLRLKGRVHAPRRSWRARTRRSKLKFTLPGPMTIVDTVADRFYGDRSRWRWPSPSCSTRKRWRCRPTAWTSSSSTSRPSTST